MPTELIEVFISYRWTEPSVGIADDLLRVFGDLYPDFQVIRDNTELGYKGDLDLYMQRLGSGSFVICIISDGYLRSRHCMKELVLLRSHPDFQQRIFPIVLDDAKIRDFKGKEAYSQFWTEVFDEQNKLFAQNTDFSFKEVSARELTLIKEIRNATLVLTDLIDNMNTLSEHIHRDGKYQVLAEYIRKEAAGKFKSDQVTIDKEKLRNGKLAPPDNLQFACDRQDQVRAILRSRRSDFRLPTFFFLSGNEEQDHYGFLERVKLELERDWWLRKKKRLKSKVSKALFPGGECNQNDLLYEFIDELDREGWGFVEDVPLEKMHFQHLIDHSAYKQEEVILLLVLIRDIDFIRAHTMNHIAWLCRSFFDPTRFINPSQEVIVMWAVKYADPNSTAQSRKLVDNLSDALGDLMIPLPELEAISQIHIDEWFDQHLKELDAFERRALIQQHFPHGIPADMLSVKKALGKLLQSIHQSP